MFLLYDIFQQYAIEVLKEFRLFLEKWHKDTGILWYWNFFRRKKRTEGSRPPPPILSKMTIDFTPLKLYSTKASELFIDLRGVFSMRCFAFSLRGVYFRFTKVRYAGRFERGSKSSG